MLIPEAKRPQRRSTERMSESLWVELAQYVGFDEEDGRRLRAIGSHVAPHFGRIADEFYSRIRTHPRLSALLAGPAQIERLHGALQAWLRLFFEGPWDDAYHLKRARIGRVHVQIELPQRYMFGAMNVIRLSLLELVDSLSTGVARDALVRSIHKLIDIELAIMLESYGEAHVEAVQHEERLEREALQQQLALSEARYGEIVEKADALIVTLDRDARILVFNAKCERLTGMTRECAFGQSWLQLFAPSADHAELVRRFEACLDGQPVPAYESAVPSDQTKRVRVRWQFTTLPEGTKPALCAIGTDVSNEHDLGVRTRRAERLAALGTMAAGLAHEIRNPLNAAHLQLTLAERRLQRANVDVDAVKTAVGVADSEMQRLGALVQDFLDFARPQPLRLVRRDLRATIEAAVALLAPEARSQQRRLEFQAPAGPVELEFDNEKIKQVLLNLVRNGLEAAEPGGVVELSLASHDDHVELIVQDDGPGLPLDAPIFEPFFTTKEDGTGLGLAIVHRIVMDHGGYVAVQSKPGDTRFIVTLPRTSRDSVDWHERC